MVFRTPHCVDDEVGGGVYGQQEVRDGHDGLDARGHLALLVCVGAGAAHVAEENLERIEALQMWYKEVCSRTPAMTL